MAQNMKAMAKKMKKKGRYGDSELVHVNPAEKKMLEDMAGGIKTKNPDTGLDEHFWSVLIPAGIGALSGLARGKGLKGALTGGLKGAALGGLTAGLGGLAGGEGFMTGLGTMFGGAGQGINGFGSLLGYGDAAASGATSAAAPLKSAASKGFSKLGDSELPGAGLGQIGGALSSSAPVGAAEQTLMGDIGKNFMTPKGLTLGLGALGALIDSGSKDPYAADMARRNADNNRIVRYNGGQFDPRFAKGGQVHTESDYTAPPMQDPMAMKRFNDAVRAMEQKLGRRLDNDEAQDLMMRMGGAGIGQMEPSPKYASGGSVDGIGGGKDDKIKAMLSDGEHVITADEVAMLGDGSNNEGHKKLYAMRKKLRKHKTGSTKQQPKAKPIESYAGIGA